MLFLFNIAKWRTWLERVQDARDPFPIDRALRWLQLESGGNVCSEGRVGKPGEQYPGHVYEAGLAQTYYSSPSAIAYGTTVDQVRAKCGGGTKQPTNLTDEDRLFHAKLAMDTVRDHRARARGKLDRAGWELSESSVDFWCFVKLTHAAPAMFDFLTPAKRAGVAPSWRAFRRYVEGLPRESVRAVNAGLASRFWHYDQARGAYVKTDYTDRVFNNCESFAGGAGGFVELELLLLIALAVGAHFVLSHLV